MGEEEKTVENFCTSEANRWRSQASEVNRGTFSFQSDLEVELK